MISSTFSPSSASTSRRKSKPDPKNKWRTISQQRIYNRRLLDALRSVRNPPPPNAHTIKDAADSALALTARGQSRWSRAILTSRFRRRKILLKAGGKIRRQRPRKPAKKPEPTVPVKEKKVRDRLRALGRLVPGCRKLSASSLLEEAADYVAALEMQVKAMRALSDALSAAAPATVSAAGDEGGLV